MKKWLSAMLVFVLFLTGVFPATAEMPDTEIVYTDEEETPDEGGELIIEDETESAVEADSPVELVPSFEYRYAYTLEGACVYGADGQACFYPEAGSVVLVKDEACAVALMTEKGVLEGIMPPETLSEADIGDIDGALWAEAVEYEEGWPLFPAREKALEMPEVFLDAEAPELFALNAPAVMLYEGDTYALEAYDGQGAVIDSALITFDSTNAECALVDASGIIRAQKAGECTVSATLGTVRLEVPVTVTANVWSASFDPESIDLIAGMEWDLTSALTLKKNGSVTSEDAAVSFVSSDTDIAQISDGGLIYAAAAGEAQITVTTARGAEAVCTIRVSGNDNALVTEDSITLSAGGMTYPLKTSAGIGTVRYTSADAAIASVNASGLITSVGAGETQIIATAENGSADAVQVIVKAEPQTIETDAFPALFREGQSFALNAKAYDANDAEIPAQLTYSVEQTGNVVSVSQDGTVTAKNTGEAEIVVTSHNGAEFRKLLSVLPTDITLISDIPSIKTGLTETYLWNVRAVNGAGETVEMPIVFTSSKASYAKVDGTGCITAVKKGSAVITASVEGRPEIEPITLNVTVAAKPTSVTLSPLTLTLSVGMKAKLTPTPNSGAGCAFYEWNGISETGTGVVTIAADGTITAAAPGTANVYTRTYNGKVNKKPCKVTVYKAPYTAEMTAEKNTIGVGQTLQMSVAAYDEAGNPVPAEFKEYVSENPSIAAIDASGRVTAIAKGSVILRISTHNDVVAKFRLTVVDAPSDLESLVPEVILGVGEYWNNAPDAFRFLPENTLGDIVFQSANSKIASVSVDGQIKGVKAGSTLVRASLLNDSTKYRDITVTVKKAPSSVKISPTKLAMGAEGMTSQLTCTLSKDSVGAVAFSSSNEAVASVDQNGLVTSGQPGTATITVKTYNNKKATCKVTVTGKPAELRLAKYAIDLYSGQAETMSAAVYDAAGKATKTNLTCEIVSGEDVIALDTATGCITALKDGTAQVRVGTHVDGLEAFVDVYVRPVPTSMTMEPAAIELGVKETFDAFDISFEPENCCEAVTWSSSKASVAKVDANGVVTGVKAGTAVITAKSCDGAIAKTCTVTVRKAPTSIKLNVSTLSAREDSAPFRLEVQLSKSSAGKVTFSSSNEAVAFVDEEGCVYFLKPGTAVITALTYNGKKATCAVKVSATPVQVYFEQEELNITTDMTATLSAYCTGVDGERTEAVYTFHTNDTDVIELNAETGAVRGLREGRAIVTVETDNHVSTHEGRIARCTVNVQKGADRIELTNPALKVCVGDTLQLKPVVYASDNERLDDIPLEYASAKTSIAKVDAGGVVKGVKKGSAKISVKAPNGKTLTVTVTVVAAPSSVKLRCMPGTLSVGETAQLETNLQAGSCAFSSGDESIATVNKDTGFVVAHRAGSVTFSVKTFNKKSASVTVQIGTGVAETITTAIEKGTGVIESDGSLYMKKGASAKLNAVSSVGSALTYVSGNTAVATVANGTVTAVGHGRTVVTVQSETGRTLTLNVVSVDPAKPVVFTEDELVLLRGETVEPPALYGVWGELPASAFVYSADGSISVSGGKVRADACGEGTLKIDYIRLGIEPGAELKVRVVSAADVAISAEDTMLTGDTQKIGVTFRGSGDIAYAVDDTSIASIAKDGTLTAKAYGSVRISVRIGEDEESASCTVDIYDRPESITLAQDTLRMNIGGTMKLTPQVDEHALPGFRFESDNARVASVDEDGTVTALRTGTAKITVSSTASDACAECTVDVSDTYAYTPKAIAFEKPLYTLAVGETVEPLVSDDHGIPAVAGLTSGNTDLLEVGADGTITAKAAGEAELTAQMGTLTAKTRVYIVTAHEKPEISDTSLTLGIGETAVLKAVTAHAGVAVEWSSGAPERVSVDPDGTIHALSTGIARITANVYGNSVACNVTVRKAPTQIRISSGDITDSVLNKGTQLTIAYPDGQSGTYKLTSSDPDVVKAGQDGSLTYIGAGEAIITAEAYNGVSDSITVTLTPAPDAIAFRYATLTLLTGTQIQNDLLFFPDGSAVDCEAVSDNPSVLTVSGDGTFRALTAGTATVTAYLSDTLTAQCKVKVGNHLDSLTVTPKAMDLQPGETCDLTYSYKPAVDVVRFRYSSSDTRVAKVDAQGHVTAVASGKCDIVVTAEEDGTQAVCAVNVGVYRLYAAYEWDGASAHSLPFSRNNAEGVISALNSSRNAIHYVNDPKAVRNPTRNAIVSGIRNTFEDAEDTDTSVIYLCSHGLKDMDGFGHYGMAMNGYELDNREGYYLNSDEMFSLASEIKGRVVLILDSCYSGYFISDQKANLNSNGRITVLTAANTTNASFWNGGSAEMSFDYFSRALLLGMGFDVCGDVAGSLLADSNGDGCVTVYEAALYAYNTTVSQVTKDYKKSSFEGNKGQKPAHFWINGGENIVLYRAK